jgi:hypothetical protein
MRLLAGTLDGFWVRNLSGVHMDQGSILPLVIGLFAPQGGPVGECGNNHANRANAYFACAELDRQLRELARQQLPLIIIVRKLTSCRAGECTSIIGMIVDFR